jgi:hypothetical protein
MASIDAIFNRSPLTPPQVDMGSGAAGTIEAPLLLLATYTTEPSLWISTGVIGTVTIPAGPQGQTETFTDNGWTILAQLRNFSSTIGPNATFDGNDVYQTPASETQSAVLAKLALPAGDGALQKLSQAFKRLLTNAWA